MELKTLGQQTCTLDPSVIFITFSLYLEISFLFVPCIWNKAKYFISFIEYRKTSNNLEAICFNNKKQDLQTWRHFSHGIEELDGWVRVLRPFNSISVISRWWKGEHERLCAMKRLQRDSNPRPRDPKSGALTARPRGCFQLKNWLHFSHAR